MLTQGPEIAAQRDLEELHLSRQRSATPDVHKSYVHMQCSSSAKFEWPKEKQTKISFNLAGFRPVSLDFLLTSAISLPLLLHSHFEFLSATQRKEKKARFLFNPGQTDKGREEEWGGKRMGDDRPTGGSFLSRFFFLSPSSFSRVKRLRGRGGKAEGVRRRRGK